MTFIHKRGIIDIDMVIWDYFMRRKWLLLTVLAVFLLSGTVSGYFLRNSDTFVVDSTVLNQPNEVETTESNIARVRVPILSEEEANAVSVAKEEEPAVETVELADSTDNLEDSSSLDNVVAAAGSVTEPAEVVEAPQESPKEVDVPLTGDSQADINAAWRSLFTAWQQATWTIFGVITVALLMVLLARYSFWRKLR